MHPDFTEKNANLSQFSQIQRAQTFDCSNSIAGKRMNKQKGSARMKNYATHRKVDYKIMYM